MKHLLISFLFVLLFSKMSFASGDKRLEYSVKSTSLDKTKPGQAKVILELKNLTGDTLIFLTWSCRPFRSLLSIDEEEVSLSPITCSGNSPAFLKLLPHSSHLDTIEVKSNRTDLISPFRVKINLVEPKEKSDAGIAQKEAEKKKFSFLTDYINIK
jgi:hypothetical protein